MLVYIYIGGTPAPAARRKSLKETHVRRPRSALRLSCDSSSLSPSGGESDEQRARDASAGPGPLRRCPYPPSRRSARRPEALEGDGEGGPGVGFGPNADDSNPGGLVSDAPGPEKRTRHEAAKVPADLRQILTARFSC
jgi:hypothetical protein